MMANELWSSPIAAWLLSFSLHGTLLAVLAYALCKTKLLSQSIQDIPWKLVLVLPLLTASIHGLILDSNYRLPWHSLNLSWADASVYDPTVREDEGFRDQQPLEPQSPSGRIMTPPSLAELPHLDRGDGYLSEEAAAAYYRGHLERGGNEAASHPSPSAASPGGIPSEVVAEVPPIPASTATKNYSGDEKGTYLLWAQWAWMAISLLSIGFHLRNRVRLRRMLQGRRPLKDGSWLRDFSTVQAAAGVRTQVRLSVSETLRSPMAFGIFRPEICVPTMALEQLDSAPRKALLAHELSHIGRRDPWWLLGFELTLVVFPWHLALRYARKQYHEAAEYAADAHAAGQCGSLSVASCLIEAARWMTGSRTEGLAAGMAAGRPSQLRKRVESLINQAPPVAGPASTKRAGWLGAMSALLLLALPSFDTRAAESEPMSASATTTPTAEQPEDIDHAITYLTVLLEVDEIWATILEQMLAIRQAHAEDSGADRTAFDATWADLSQRVDSLDEKRRSLKRLIMQSSPSLNSDSQAGEKR